MRKVLAVVVTACALFAGIMIGIGASSGEVKTVHDTKTVTVTPSACMTALTDADRAFWLMGQGFDKASALVTAASQLDAAAMQAANDALTPIEAQTKVATQAYATARDECEAQQ